MAANGGGVNSVWAQSAYWTEDFEDALGSGWTLSGASMLSNSSMSKKLGSQDLRISKKAGETVQYVITPTFSKGVSTITFWQCREADRTLTVYTSTDGGTSWWKHTTVTANSSEIATVTINSMTVNRIKIANESSSDADIDDLTVNTKATVWSEDFENTTVETLQSVWTNGNNESWPGTYGSTFDLKSNSCGNSSTWFLTYGNNWKRQTTAYYLFNSPYTGKAYQYNARLNLNDGINNNNGTESHLYFMNGAKSGSNNAPSNYLFFIGVNTSGNVFISNGSDTLTTAIGGLNSGTNSIAATLWGKNYKSTGWFDASCVIDFEKGTANVTIKSGNTTENKSLALKSGTKQLSGIGVLNGAKQYGVVAMDDITLYELTYPTFELSETLKEVAKGGNVSVDVTGLKGTISITSADEDIATASYADGAITINGVSLGTTTLTVSCTNDGFTITKDIDVTVENGITYNTPALYSEDFENENYNIPGDAGWKIVGGSATIETNADASINKYACFNAVGASGNRGQYYNFASASEAGNYWKIEFDAALTAGGDKTESSVAITSDKSGDVATNNAASGDLYFLCKQKTNGSNVYEVFLGNSTSEVSATYTLTNGTFYHFIITYNGTTVTAKIGSNAKISKDVNASTVGALKGLKTCESRVTGYVRIDNITLHNFNGPAFTLAETKKTVNQGGNGTVSVTGVEGEISVESDDTSVATASYADGTITITGVGAGTANITVNCFNNGLNASAGTIEATIISYADQYTTAKAVYDAKVENLDAAGQAYWTANVTDAASIVDASSYSAAIAALPTTYLAAVKAQGAGSDMTDAMPSALTDWTCSQGNGPGTYATTFTETYSDGTNKPKFVAGDIMSQTISGLPAGYYRVQFYGVVNSAWSVSDISETTSNLVQAYANSTTADIDVYAQTACTPTDYLRTIEAEVTESGTLTYGLKAKDGVTDAGNWAVAKIYSLTYLGTGKNDYTINAVAGETTIKQLSTGEAWASETYGTYIPKVILYNSKYYVLDDDGNENISSYYASYTMGATDAVKEINYTLDESIVAFVEGESSTANSSTSSSYSDGHTGYVKTQNYWVRGKSLGTLSQGIYQLEAYISSNAFRGLCVRNTTGNYSSNDGCTTWAATDNSSTGLQKERFKLTDSYELVLNGKDSGTRTNQSADFDYAIIRKLNVNDDYVIVGTIDNATAYLTDMTDKVTLKPGESYRYQFVNHNGRTNNWKNWVLPVYDSNDEKKIVVRADNHEDMVNANTGCTSNFDWTEFVADMDGAMVDMTVTFTKEKVFTMSANITTSMGKNWTYSYTSNYTGTTIDLTSNDYIKVALSVSNSWAEVVSEGYTMLAPTISAVNYGTYSSDYALDFEHATGIQAYYSTATAGGKIIMTKVNTAVAAREGLFIEKIDGDISIPVVDSGATLTGNKLKAGGVKAPADSYVFAKQDDVLGFYRLTSDTNIPKGKAYLEAGTYGARLTIMFDDETTGISELKQAEQMNLNETVYNLRGQRVDKPGKGLFIVNGHKVVVK